MTCMDEKNRSLFLRNDIYGWKSGELSLGRNLMKLHDCENSRKL
jgi:hypothetical protein